MIVDIHTHLFPPEIREDRQRYFDEEPAFKLLYQPEKSKMVGAREMIDAMDQNGVDVSVVFGFPWRAEVLYRRHNEYILDAIARFPKRLVGLCCFDPLSPGAAAETERCLENGFSGVGELAFYRSGIDAEARELLAPIFAICEEKNRPVLIHTNEPVGHIYPGKTPNTFAQIFQLVERFHQNRIILAHWGGGILFFQMLKKGFKEVFKNVFFDTAASPFLYDPGIYRLAADLVGAGRILLGSDYPLIPPKRYLDELAHCGLDRPDIDSICGLNAVQLLQL